MKINNYNDMNYVQHRFMKVKNKLLNKYSPAESHFEDLLKESGVYYVRERSNFRISTRWCYYDFHLPLYRLYVEIDGPEHEIESHKVVDEEKFDIIASKQRFLVRLKNQEVLDMETLDMDYILNKLVEQSKYKLWFTSELSIGRYLNNIITNLEQAYDDYFEASGISLKSKEPIYVYNKQIGRAYIFENKITAEVALQSHVSTVNDLLMRDYSKPNTLRKFVLAHSEEELRNRVKSCLLIDDFPAPKESFCHLVHAMSEIMDNHMIFLPSLPKFFSHIFISKAKDVVKAHHFKSIDELLCVLFKDKGYKTIHIPHISSQKGIERCIIAYDKEKYGEQKYARSYIWYGKKTHRILMREIPYEELCSIYEMPLIDNKM